MQIPRLYQVFASTKPGAAFSNFDELLRNIFLPMFEATLHPDKHLKLHTLLQHVGYLDCVDDESVHDLLILEPPVPPSEYAASNTRFQFGRGKNAGKPENPVCFHNSFCSLHLALRAYTTMHSCDRAAERKPHDVC